MNNICSDCANVCPQDELSTHEHHRTGKIVCPYKVTKKVSSIIDADQGRRDQLTTRLSLRREK